MLQQQMLNGKSSKLPSLPSNESNKGLGGVIILGNAEISETLLKNKLKEFRHLISNGLYGGSDNSDDSGVIRYIQIVMVGHY